MAEIVPQAAAARATPTACAAGEAADEKRKTLKVNANHVDVVQEAESEAADWEKDSPLLDLG